MKKIFTLLFLAVFTITAYCQERTVDLGSIDINNTKWIAYNYVGTSDRLIPTTRDTIDFNLTLLNVKTPLHAYVNVTFDTIAGADTTVIVALLSKVFNSQSYGALTSGVSNAVTAEIQKSVTTIGVLSENTETVTNASHAITGAAFTIKQDTAGFRYYPADSLKVPATTFTEASYTASITKVSNASLYYRYFKVRLIISGNDSVGTGIKVKRVEIQFF